MYKVLIVDDEPAVLDMEKRAIRMRARISRLLGRPIRKTGNSAL